jgi:hypothetical protein
MFRLSPLLLLFVGKNLWIMPGKNGEPQILKIEINGLCQQDGKPEGGGIPSDSVVPDEEPAIKKNGQER